MLRRPLFSILLIAGYMHGPATYMVHKIPSPKFLFYLTLTLGLDLGLKLGLVNMKKNFIHYFNSITVGDQLALATEYGSFVFIDFCVDLFILQRRQQCFHHFFFAGQLQLLPSDECEGRRERAGQLPGPVSPGDNNETINRIEVICHNQTQTLIYTLFHLNCGFPQGQYYYPWLSHPCPLEFGRRLSH